jgi:YD repeat-containing protein
LIVVKKYLLWPTFAASLLLLGCNEKPGENGLLEESQTDSPGKRLVSGDDSVLPDRTHQDQNTPTEKESSDQLATLVSELTGQILTNGKTSWSDANEPIETIFQEGSRILYSVGKPKQYIDALGNKSSYDFDEKGLLNQRTDSEGNIERFDYDASGQIVSKVDKDGNLIKIDATQRSE